MDITVSKISNSLADVVFGDGTIELVDLNEREQRELAKKLLIAAERLVRDGEVNCLNGLIEECNL
jgi:hypothetical protein